jgi:dGTPase
VSVGMAAPRSIYACDPDRSRGRLFQEPPSKTRSPFRRDCDRVIHSTAFRRLKHKTQVFVFHEGDHYRTRLTHSLEVAQIARALARQLGLDEDLTETLALAHDLGHPPFGHAGEQALDELLRERGAQGFRHNEHSLRVVETLEREGRGLNLTEEVRDGILKHTGPDEPETLEGKIVRIVDRVAYINHDIDDAIRAGMISADDLPQHEIAILGDTGSRRIDTLVHDLVETSAEAGDIAQSDEIGTAMLSLRAFMFERVYLGPEATREHAKIDFVIRTLFERYCANPEMIPDSVTGGDLAARVTDHIAGMTDRFCIAAFEALCVPVAFAP